MPKPGWYRPLPPMWIGSRRCPKLDFTTPTSQVRIRQTFTRTRLSKQTMPESGIVEDEANFTRTFSWNLIFDIPQPNVEE
jgi:hypothetical protein